MENHEQTNDLFHLWNNCSACGASPIYGVRFECQTCPLGPDSDLCSGCYEGVQNGQLQHPSPDNYMTAHLIGIKHHFNRIEGRPATETDSWFEVPLEEKAAPGVVNGFVVRPEFCAGFESTFAGYGFVVNVPHYAQSICHARAPDLTVVRRRHAAHVSQCHHVCVPRGSRYHTRQ